MKNFVGIDLGTTNSAICSYDGKQTRIWKSPEQNDVTPSAIYIDRRGNKYVGKRAYDSAPANPDNAATLFKRLMGTSTPIKFAAAGVTMMPEECSAEVLKVLFGYLPEEIRNDPETGTVITVPAAFNQMQKDATMQAANMAGLGKVALMQEPVAAVMSVMRAAPGDGVFLIYDFGGGTLDIAIAESQGGGVNLLSHGGIAMCGGRDFDRALLDSVVRPWLSDNFDLPDDLAVNERYKPLLRLAAWAAEKAKIELSGREDSVISLSENEIRAQDESGKDIYLDIPIERPTFDELIKKRIDETIAFARDTIDKAGLSAQDLQRIVFIGGPTNYKPLRDQVALGLGVEPGTEVNPMTAVAEGASLFAESIDWSSSDRARKSSRGQITSSAQLGLTFNYVARTPERKAKIAVQLTGGAPSGFEFQIDSIDTGWTSGRKALVQGASVDVDLPTVGENTFKAFVFGPSGGPIALEQNRIVITRAAATINAIPASHSIAIEALEKLGGAPVLDYLVRKDDPLPKKGQKTFKAAESLKSGSGHSLNFKLWEGEIEDSIQDNRSIGVLKILGTDFDSGVIPAGADLECEYEILDSGNINLEVSVPCIGSTFRSNKNFYSRQEGQVDYTQAADQVIQEGYDTLKRLDKIENVVDDPKLDAARDKLESAVNLDAGEAQTEDSMEAMENVLEARKLLAQVRKDHRKEIRQIDLDSAMNNFDSDIRRLARPSERVAFDNLAKTAQRAIDRNDKEFENHLEELKNRMATILVRQDSFIVEVFNEMAAHPERFTDRGRFNQLVEQGGRHLAEDNIYELRRVVGDLANISKRTESGEAPVDATNILKG